MGFHSITMENDTKIVEINIAQQFSDTPGARFITDGPKSGQEFREKFLEPFFTLEHNDTILHIYLDGTKGYAPSFLEESFGGLVRKFGKIRVKEKIRLFATEMEYFREKCYKYIDEAE